MAVPNDFNFPLFGSAATAPRCFLGTTAPTAGNYNAGDITFNSAPSSDGTALWLCSVSGSPGTWVAVTALSAAAVAGLLTSQAELTTTATSGTLSSAYAMILLNPASTGTYSLPNVTAYPAGGQLLIKNIASGSTTLTPLAANNYEATSIAAITLAQNARVTLRSAGGTTWYLAST